MEDMVREGVVLTAKECAWYDSHQDQDFMTRIECILLERDLDRDNLRSFVKFCEQEARESMSEMCDDPSQDYAFMQQPDEHIPYNPDLDLSSEDLPF